MVSLLKEIPDLKVNTPEGAFYLFPTFVAKKEQLQAAGIHDDGELCARIIDEIGVAMLPGRDFQVQSDRFFTRLSYVNFDGEEALEEFYETGNAEDVVNNHCAETLEAAERVAEWFSKF